jgi:AraC-like DNA-binding protein
MNEGYTGIARPDICLFRFTRPQDFTKAAAFGVTLGVVLQGEKLIKLADQDLTVDPEQLIVITREVAYESRATRATKDRPFLGLSLLFRPEQVAKALVALAEAGGTSSDEQTSAFQLPLDGDIVDALDRLLRTLDDPLDRTLIAPLINEEILFRLLRSDAAAAVRAGVGPAQDATRILEAMQFIRANPAKKLSVESIAKTVAMSPSHFAHRFTAVARTSPMRYVREVRLERAKALLGEHGARPGDVATRVGFETAAHFTREFKRRYGVPPSQFLPR